MLDFKQWAYDEKLNGYVFLLEDGSYSIYEDGSPWYTTFEDEKNEANPAGTEPFAKLALLNMVDKSGAPLVDHALRMAETFDTNYEKVLCHLHDLVEDTHMTIDDIADCFGPFIANDIFYLTRPDDMTYFDYIERLKTEGSQEAINVKLADINDHLTDTSHIPASLVYRYNKAKSILLGERPTVLK